MSIKDVWSSLGREEGEFETGDVVVFQGGYTNKVGLTMTIEDVQDYYRNKQVIGLYPNGTMLDLRR